VKVGVFEREKPQILEFADERINPAYIRC